MFRDLARILLVLGLSACTYVLPSTCDAQACAPMACVDGACMLECHDDKECANGFVCDYVLNDCVECVRDADCDEEDNEYCVRSLCQVDWQ